jgi:O-antigen ligase
MACFYGWFVWVGFSKANSVAPELSTYCVMHFGAAVLVAGLGMLVLSRLPDTQPFWLIVALGFLYVFWIGIEQHNGGLEATRKAFFANPDWEKFPKEYQLKVQSNRIFGPFIYPNTFAGAILLWCPALVVSLWTWAARFPSLLQKLVVGLFATCGAACLYWTGSKAGWLIAVAMIGVGLLHLNIKRAVKIGVIAGVLVAGLAGFALKNRAYFEKGATSASARFIYWKAALQVANSHPFLGAGPGTFVKTFAPLKPPEAEMARLVHNDYLEQASDSGWPACLLFSGFVVGGLVLGHRKVALSKLHLAVWLGLLAWALQGFVEFGLYIPAIAWSAFLLMGWLLTCRNAIDTAKPNP